MIWERWPYGISPVRSAEDEFEFKNAQEVAMGVISSALTQSQLAGLLAITEAPTRYADPKLRQTQEMLRSQGRRALHKVTRPNILRQLKEVKDILY